MPTQVQSIPKGYHSVTPYLVVNDAARAMDFYRRAFGAKEIMRMDGPNGKIAHAELKIGDSVIMLSDEMPGAGTRSPQSLGGSTAGIFLYVENVDSVFTRRSPPEPSRTRSPPTCFGVTAMENSLIRLVTYGRWRRIKRMFPPRR